MSISLIDFLGRRLLKASKIYIKPNIPIDKAMNAINSYAGFLSYEEIIVLVDDTVFGSSKEGMIITDKEIIAKAPFESVIYREMMEIEELTFKKGILGSSVIIDDRKQSFSQPDANDLRYLIDKCNEYIETLWLNYKNELEAQAEIETEAEAEAEAEDNVNSEYSNNDIEILKKKILQLESELKNKTQEKQTVQIEEHNLTEDKKESLFRTVPDSQDILIEFAKKRTNIGTSLLTSFLTFDDAERISNIFVSYLSMATVEIRENYIDRKNIIGLKNDLATIETFIYVTSILKNELLSRDANERFIMTIIKKGLDDFFFVNKYPNNQKYVMGICNLVFEPMPNELMTGLYALRLYINNKQGRIADTDIEYLLKNPIFQEITNEYITEDVMLNSQSPEEAITKIISPFAKKVFSELGYISLDQSILSLKNNITNDILQQSRECGLM